MKRWIWVLIFATACGGGSKNSLIKADGSSTVYPITEAVAEEFKKIRKDVDVTVGISGTGGGFKKFSRGELDVVDASRTIKPSEEKMARDNKIDFIELKIALDGIVIVVNKNNTFAECLSVADLKKIWSQESKAHYWSDLRSSWPREKFALFGPGTDSGTFDYFTEEINGAAKRSRHDFTASEDDNTLVTGVSTNKYAMGYFGFAYYFENRDKLRALPVDGGNGCVAPTPETIESGSYKPLSRPLYLYVAKESFKKPAVNDFVRFYIANISKFVMQVGYIALTESQYKEEEKKLDR